jgi:2-(1,2-epoxy-1,2-dihydrophenyl)acetyl-CoA isomerase
MQDVVDLKQDGSILTITMNRPERLNALNRQLMRRLRETISEAALDTSVRVVIITGAGRAFCAGGDIKGATSGEMEDDTDPLTQKLRDDPRWSAAESSIDRLMRDNVATKLLHTMPKPTIAMVRGAAAGAGLCMVAACDFALVSDKSVFTAAFSKIAYPGDYGGSYFITKRVGPTWAKRLYFLSNKIGPETAHKIGLVDEVHPDAELEARVMELAQRLAKGPPVAYRFIKQNIFAAETENMDTVLALESNNQTRARFTEDWRLATGSFLSGKEIEFKGM